MAKVWKAFGPDGITFHGYIIECPACGHGHLFDDRWTFNGNYDKPSFSPSMLVNAGEPDRRCHSFVTDGKIQYLDDCFHEFKGKTIEFLHDIEEVE